MYASNIICIIFYTYSAELGCHIEYVLFHSIVPQGFVCLLTGSMHTALTIALALRDVCIVTNSLSKEVNELGNDPGKIIRKPQSLEYSPRISVLLMSAVSDFQQHGFDYIIDTVAKALSAGISPDTLLSFMAFGNWW